MPERDELLAGMGKRILARRKEMGLSQEELAERAGITIQMLSTAERGAKGMRPINLLKLSEALNVSADYLLTGRFVDADKCLLIEKIEGLNPDQRVALNKVIDSFISVCK